MMTALVISGLMLLAVLPMTGSAEGFEASHSDPEGDVIDYGRYGSDPVLGHEDIDIIELSSTEAQLLPEVTIFLTVAGSISEDEGVTYSITITDDDYEEYNIFCTGGTCSGYGYDEDTVLVTTGWGTSVLEIHLPEEELTGIDDFIRDFTDLARNRRFIQCDFS